MEEKITRHAGMFKPGQSGNPSGRPRSDIKIRDLARKYTKLAINTLAEIAQNPKASDNSRVAACNALLDRSHGKAPQYVEKRELTVSYVDYLEMLAKQENERIESVEANYTVDNL